MDGIEELMEFVEIRVQGVEGAIKGDTASVTLNNLLEMTKYVDKTFEPVRRFVDIELIAGNVVTKLFWGFVDVEYGLESGGDPHPHFSCGKTGWKLLRINDAGHIQCFCRFLGPIFQ
jgi:hypothetical protein